MKKKRKGKEDEERDRREEDKKLNRIIEEGRVGEKEGERGETETPVREVN